LELADCSFGGENTPLAAPTLFWFRDYREKVPGAIMPSQEVVSSMEVFPLAGSSPVPPSRSANPVKLPLWSRVDYDSTRRSAE
jgi:hypothetical protein